MPGERPSHIPPENPFSSQEGKLPPEPTQQFVERYLGKTREQTVRSVPEAAEGLAITDEERDTHQRELLRIEALHILNLVDPAAQRLFSEETPTEQQRERDNTLSYYAASLARAGELDRAVGFAAGITDLSEKLDVYVACARYQIERKEDPHKMLGIVAAEAEEVEDMDRHDELLQDVAIRYAEAGYLDDARDVIRQIYKDVDRAVALEEALEFADVPPQQRLDQLAAFVANNFTDDDQRAEFFLEIAGRFYDESPSGTSSAARALARAEEYARIVPRANVRTARLRDVAEAQQRMGLSFTAAAEEALRAARHVELKALRITALQELGKLYASRLGLDTSSIVAALEQERVEGAVDTETVDHAIAVVQLAAGDPSTAERLARSTESDAWKLDLAPQLLRALVAAGRDDDARTVIALLPLEERENFEVQRLTHVMQQGRSAEAVDQLAAAAEAGFRTFALKQFFDALVEQQQVELVKAAYVRLESDLEKNAVIESVVEKLLEHSQWRDALNVIALAPRGVNDMEAKLLVVKHPSTPANGAQRLAKEAYRELLGLAKVRGGEAQALRQLTKAAQAFEKLELDPLPPLTQALKLLLREAHGDRKLMVAQLVDGAVAAKQFDWVLSVLAKETLSRKERRIVDLGLVNGAASAAYDTLNRQST